MPAIKLFANVVQTITKATNHILILLFSNWIGKLFAFMDEAKKNVLDAHLLCRVGVHEAFHILPLPGLKTIYSLMGASLNSFPRVVETPIKGGCRQEIFHVARDIFVFRQFSCFNFGISFFSPSPK